MRGELPVGWIMSELRTLFELKYGKGLPKETRSNSGQVNVYGSNGIVGIHNKAITKSPTIIIGRKGSVGEVHYSKEPCWPIDTTYYIDEFPSDFPPSYWKFFLRSLELGQKEKSSAIPGINREDIYTIEIPIPPINEQRRIVKKLENLLEKVESSRTRLEKIPAILKRFRQSLLAAACSCRLTADWREQSKQSIGNSFRDNNTDLPEIPESWRWVKLPDTGEMSRGKSRNRPRNEPSLFDGKYPFIQTGDIAQSGGRITSHKQTYNEAGLAQSRLWPANTICITIAANIAESAILTYQSCFPDSVVGIIANPEVCVAEYVEFFIRVAKADLSTFAPATAQKNINIAILNEVAVPLPPLTEQHEIVRRVEELFALVDRIEGRYQKAKTQVDKLTQSILAKAFRGELVPQDPNDEPASELLKRIKVQNLEGRNPRKPKRRKKPRNSISSVL